MGFCVQCGTKMAGAFCANCGAQANVPSATTPPARSGGATGHGQMLPNQNNNNAPGKGYLKITGILFIIFGGISALTAVIGVVAAGAMLGGAGAFGRTPGNLVALLIGLALLGLAVSAFSIIMGIIGVKNATNLGKAQLCFTLGIIYIAIQGVSFLISFASPSTFNVFGLVGFILPVLFLIGANKNKKALIQGPSQVSLAAETPRASQGLQSIDLGNHYPAEYGGGMSSGMACFHHPSGDAVARCAKCKNNICSDCRDKYGVTSGEYEGYALCYDCTCGLIAENVQYFEHFKQRVDRSRKTMIVLACVGGFIGLASGIGAGDAGAAFAGLLFGGAIGASFGTIMSDIWLSLCVAFGMAKDSGGLFSEDGMSSFGWGLLFGLIRTIGMCIASPVIAIYQYVKRLKQMKEAEEIMANDSHALREIRDYFAYTQTMERNIGVSLSSLAEQGGELFDNTYAQSILKNGEQAAQAELRQSVVQISANGEILRSFSDKPRRTAA